MDELEKNLEKEDIKDVYQVYLEVVKAIEDLNDGKRELPPKEEI